ncbi:MAG: M48 family metalloprotease [Treponema sp.]|jgi:predicted Zn-dependent protease|nr:M48 family metalloprotease [Treponema sp.]
MKGKNYTRSGGEPSLTGVRSAEGIGAGRRALIIAFVIAAFVMTAFFSCQSLGTVAQIGAAIGQATGLINESTADAIAKSGVAFGAAFEEITPEQEYYIGRAVAANVLTRYSLQPTTSAMTAYINKICNALIINSPRPEIFNGYHVAILDSDEINAFATPGGHIFITRGLINCATSEDTLAAVIAHEIAHVQLQHGLKAIKNNRFTNALLITGTSAASAAGNATVAELTNTFGDSVGEIVSTMVSSGYSRSQELDADSFAMSLMSLAGYEPSSMIDMLQVLERNQSSRPGGFNNTHPTPAQRISNARTTVGNYDVPDTRSYRQARYATTAM